MSINSSNPEQSIDSSQSLDDEAIQAATAGACSEADSNVIPTDPDVKVSADNLQNAPYIA